MRSVPSRLLLTVLLSGLCMGNIDLAIVNVAAPSIHDTLGASGAQLQLVVSAYVISYAMLLIVAARLGQMRGYGRMFVLGAGVFTLASLGCGLAPDATQLIAARAVQGVGGAFMVAQVLSGIQLNYSGQERVRAIGAYAMALSAAAVIGQILGGVLIAANLFGAAWRPAFLVNVPIGVLLILAAVRVLPMQHAGRSEAIDLRGAASLTGAVVLAIVPLILGREQHWPLWTWLCLALSVPATAVFVVVERQVARSGGHPLVNLEVLSVPRVAWGLIAAAAALATYFAMLFVLALYLQQGLGRSPLYSGLALVSWVAAFGISGPLLRRIAPTQVPHVAVAGYLIQVASYLALSASLALSQGANGGLLVTLLGFVGLGLGLGRNSTIADMTNSVAGRFAADMSGLINTASQLSGAAGVALFGTLYLSIAPQGGFDQALPAFEIVSLGFAVVALLASVAGYAAFAKRGAPATAAMGA